MMHLNGLPPELAQFVQQELASGRYASEDELVREALRLLQAQKHEANGTRVLPSTEAHDSPIAPPSSTGHEKPIWEKMIETSQHVPEEELDQLPTDLAAQVDHYIYGTPKR